MQRAVWQDESVAFGEESPAKPTFKRLKAPWDAPSLTSQDLRDEDENRETARNFVMKNLWDPPSEADLAAAYEKELATANYKYTTPWVRDVSTENIPVDINVAPKAVYRSLWAEDEMSEARKKQLAEYKMDAPFSTSVNETLLVPNVKPLHYTPTFPPYLQGTLSAPPIPVPSHKQRTTSLWDSANSDVKKPTLESSGDPILDSLRNQLRQCGADGINGLARKFRIMDDDRSGALDMNEFRKAMKESRLNLTDRQLKHLFLYFDKDDSGSICYDEFLAGVRGVLNGRRKAMVALAFAVLDANGSGKIDISDFQQAYNCAQHPQVINGKMTEHEALVMLMSNFESGAGKGDGVITTQEFEAYYSNVSASIDSDDCFELMIRNAWHISGGDGWCSNTTNMRALVLQEDGSQRVEQVKSDLGVKIGDKQGMVAKLRAQGIAAKEIETSSSVNQAVQPSAATMKHASATALNTSSPRPPQGAVQALSALVSNTINVVPARPVVTVDTSSRGSTPRSGGGTPKPVSLGALLAVGPSPRAAENVKQGLGGKL